MCSTVTYNTVKYSTGKYDAVQCDTMEYDNVKYQQNTLLKRVCERFSMFRMVTVVRDQMSANGSFVLV